MTFETKVDLWVPIFFVLAIFLDLWLYFYNSTLAISCMVLIFVCIIGGFCLRTKQPQYEEI